MVPDGPLVIRPARAYQWRLTKVSKYLEKFFSFFIKKQHPKLVNNYIFESCREMDVLDKGGMQNVKTDISFLFVGHTCFLK